MALKAIVDSIEGLSEDIKKEYTEKDGKWHLDVSGIDTGDELKTALAKERDARREADRKLKESDDKAAADAKKTLEEKEDYKKLWQTEKEEKEKLRIENNVTRKTSYADAIVNSLTTSTKKAKLLRDQVIGNLEIDGDKVIIKGIAGVETADELTGHLKKEYDFLVDGRKSSGGDANGDGDKGGDSKTKEMTQTEFNALSETAKMETAKKGVSVVPD